MFHRKIRSETSSNFYEISVPSCVADKRISQLQGLMRKFSEAHKEQCRAFSLDIPQTVCFTKHFPTGSQYKGSWDLLGMSGHGVYTFPNGVIYEGDFKEGVFHGEGQLRYKNNVTVRGKFVNGVMTERTLFFDNIEYTENDWNYCKMPDRRFTIEYNKGLKAGGDSYLTAEQPTKAIPAGRYDTGDGFYDAKTKSIYKYEDMSAIVRAPAILEQEWIVRNCRVNPEKPLGPCPDLYEEYTEPVLKPETPSPPADGTECIMTSPRTQPTCKQDVGDITTMAVNPCLQNQGGIFLDFGGSSSDSSSSYSDD